jgi:hypothetical protein
MAGRTRLPRRLSGQKGKSAGGNLLRKTRNVVKVSGMGTSVLPHARSWFAIPTGSWRQQKRDEKTVAEKSS